MRHNALKQVLKLWKLLKEYVIIKQINTVGRTNFVNQTAFLCAEIAFSAKKEILPYFIIDFFVRKDIAFDFLPFVFADIDVIVDAAFSMKRTLAAELPDRFDIFQSFDFKKQFSLDFG